MSIGHTYFTEWGTNRRFARIAQNYVVRLSEIGRMFRARTRESCFARAEGSEVPQGNECCCNEQRVNLAGCPTNQIRSPIGFILSGSKFSRASGFPGKNVQLRSG